MDQSVISRINQIGVDVANACSTEDAQARESLFFFLIGCYCGEHKQYLIKAEQEILKLEIPCKRLEGFDVPEIDKHPNPNYARKFRLVCQEMLRTYRVPIPLIYASSKYPTCGNGVDAELVALSENQAYEKLWVNVRLFEEEGAKLPHQEKSIFARTLVSSGDDFVIKALKICQIELNRMVDILNKGVNYVK